MINFTHISHEVIALYLHIQELLQFSALSEKFL